MSRLSFKNPFQEEEGPFRSLLIMGPPGVGKGTLGKFLSSAGNHYHLSSGQVFRGLSPESSLGKKIHTYTSEGKLVPDELTVEIWRHYLGGLIATNTYFPSQQLLMLDGIPRTRPQAKLMAEHLEVVHLIVLEVKQEEKLLKRLKRRALIERRHDDFDPDILKTRMETYRLEAEGLLDFYPEAVISRFNADQSPLEVLRDVLMKLTPLFV